MDEPTLSPEDQQKVDAFLERGVNAVERKPFRPFRLLIFLVVIVSALSGLSLLLARVSGVY
jgi:AmiR/NasT family two-component response regulator